MSDHIAALAENLRRLRETHGLSLSQLSERSGVAKATLFKIERGQTNPTLETLMSVADTFDVAVPALIDIPQRTGVEVVRSGEGQDISDAVSRGSILRNQVIGAGTLEIHEQVFAGGQPEVSASHGPGTREHVLVRSGRISVGPVSEEVELTAGDYATYPADRTHRWEAIDSEASVWIVHTFPRAAMSAEAE